MKNSSSFSEYIEADMNIEKIDFVFKFTTDSPTWSYNPGKLSYNMILLILKGEGVFTFDNETVYAAPDDLLFIPQGTSFRSRGLKDIFEYYCLQFYTSDSENDFPFKKKYKTDSPDYFHHLYEEMFENWLTKKIGYKFRIKSIAYQILTKMLKEDTQLNENVKALNIINKSLSYMRHNYYEPNLNIEDIAKQSDITSAHFRNLFKEIYNVSPLKHINKMRILRATQLLEYTDMPVNQISNEVGIPNVYHFNKLFRNIIGTSPSNYRQINRQ